MTEQTGNSKPNDAEALAFPLSDNEKLIEAARRLPDQYRVVQLSETQYLEDQALAELDAVGYQAVHTASRLADALEAAEKALTPTDDEREVLDYLDEMNEAGRIEYDDYRNLHDLISGAVEPAREMFPGTLAALDDLTTLPRKGQER